MRLCGLLLLFLLLTAPSSWAERIHDAASAGDVEAVRALLKEDPKRANARNAGGAAPLLYADVFGRLEAARLLVEAGADMDAAQGDGFGIEYAVRSVWPAETQAKRP